jgi:predicted secreted protein
MKRMLSLVLIGMMIMGTTAMAAEEDVMAVPTLYEAQKNYTIEQNGDEFTIIVSENASTGYMWNNEISDNAIVEFVSEENIINSEPLLGASYEKRMTFTVLANGVATIVFRNARPFGEHEVADTFTLVVYKNGDTLIIEEEQTFYALDADQPVLYALSETATYNGDEIGADVSVQEVNGVTMVPLRATLEAMGYTVTWNGEIKSVEIQKGPQWTTIYIGMNSYFKNKMAAHELSSAPVIMNNRTLVPIEFFADIIGKGIEVNNLNINFLDMEAVIHSGYIKSMSQDETGTITLTLTSDITSDSIELQTIIRTGPAFTFYNREVAKGDYIQVVSSMIMTMSIPGQTVGYVVY